MFLGEFHHTLDEEGRLTLPARWRERLGLSVVITRGLDRCLFVFPADKFERIAQEISQISFNKADARCLSRYFFAKAASVEPDKQANITVPPDLRSYAGIASEAVIIGVNDRIEIWDPERYRQAEETILAEATTVAERLAARSAPGV